MSKLSVSCATVIALLVAVAASCGGVRETEPPPGMPIAPPLETSLPVVRTAPLPHVTTPMPGEPDGAALARARLLTESCSGNEADVKALVQKRIHDMRAAVDAARDAWRSQPSCSITVQDVTSGGFGLTGVGEGGGGYGSGIGLGAIGTIGHGRARSASGTNDQVAGVDEADLVKNDGAYVYIVSSGALRIAEAMHPRLLSVTRLPGDAREMVIQGDRAVVFVAVGGRGEHPCTYGYDCTFGGDGSQTRIVVLDVKDRAHPVTLRTIELSGSLIAARRIGDTVHAVVADHDTPEADYETEPDHLPDCVEHVKSVMAKFEQLKRDNERKIRAATPSFPTLTDQGARRELCEVMHTPLGDGKAFTSVVSFDLTKTDGAITTATVQSRPGAVFASERSLVLSVGHRREGRNAWYPFYASADEVSDLHQFRIGSRPEETRYTGSGVVPGHVLNQFSMDAWDGYLRVATTRGRAPDPEAESVVSILTESEGGNLVRVGAVDHIAPSEDIRAVRFDGDRGYVVTFKKTDPLFVLDLGHAAAPSILGELKIPGFSTYLHRIDPTHLLSIGFDAVDHGSFAFFDGVILQLFDVTRPTEPVLLHREKIGSRGSSSEAATDHLAFNYFDDRKVLAIPMTICEGGGDGTFGDVMSFSGLLVYDVSVEHGFRRLGGVDHGKAGASCSAWWSHASSVVKRSIFMDDLVFSIASDRMKVQKMSAFGEDLADIALAP